MVKNRLFCGIFLFTLSLSLSGCGKFWGEAPPARGQIRMKASSNGCGEIEEILQASDDARSKQVYECWEAEVKKLFTQVNGEVPSSLSVAEIHVLIDRHVLNLGIPAAEAKARIAPAFEFFGIGARLSVSRMEEWLTYTRENRAILRQTFQHFFGTVAKQSLPSEEELRGLLTMANGFIATARWPASFSIVQLRTALDQMIGLSPLAQERLQAAAELFSVTGPDLGSQLAARLNWALKQRHELLHATELVASKTPLVAADIPRLAQLFQETLQSLTWNDNTADFTWIRKQLLTLLGPSSLIWEPLDHWSRFLGVETGPFRPNLLSRINWTLKNSSEIQALFQKLVTEKRSLQDSGFPRLLSLAQSYLSEVHWDDRLLLSELNSILSRIFNLSPAEMAQLLAAEQLSGLTDGHLSEKLRKRLDWTARNWNALLKLPQHLNPEHFFLSRDGKTDLDLLASFANLSEGTDAPISLDDATFLDALTKITGLSARDRAKAEAVRDLLGLAGKDFPTKLLSRIQYLQAHFKDLSWMYQRLTTGLKPFRYAKVRRALAIGSDLLKQTQWSFTPEQLSEKLVSLLNLVNREAERAAPPLARVALNALAFVCPDITELSRWKSQELASCLRKVPDAFAGSAEWVDFELDPPLGVPTPQATLRLQAALVLLEKTADSWFRQPGLKAIPTRSLLELAEALGAKPPSGFIDSLAVIERFGGKSNRDALDPTALAYMSHVYKNYAQNLFVGFPAFAQPFYDRRCRNASPRSPEDCIPSEFDLHNPAIALALQSKNLEFGSNAVPFNLSRFRKIMLYHAVGEQMIKAFDTTGSGFIWATERNGQNEVAEMMTVGIAAWETLQLGIKNVERRLNGKPVLESPEPFSFYRYDLRGLARAVSMFATDLLVSRPRNEQDSYFNLLPRLLKAIGDIEPESATFLDAQGIAAGIDLVDSLSHYRESYVRAADPRTFRQMQASDSPGGILIRRSRVVDVLPDFLRTEFPRTYESCMQWGFEKSCGKILSAILAPGERDLIPVSDLDVIALFAVGVESLVDSCDRNGNGLLDLDTFWVEDELSCAVKKATTVTSRLIAARVIAPANPATIQRILGLLNLHELTRGFVKTALIDGSSRYAVLTPARIPLDIVRGVLLRSHEHASIGSIYALVSDLAGGEENLK